ncbi:CPBP family intramembrane glutamic endopeptidase [Natrialba sp. PRR66]|uniref:CPBP family intramembrane glutamic endopeptidase n=1 Tax=Natrialba sp. PRR66 TaxID=3098146 RepID=UPI002B1E3E7E|nr:CPBP family intramembrane glutamic endopeptidase [Natrialba sp. PRR66]
MSRNRSRISSWFPSGGSVTGFAAVAVLTWIVVEVGLRGGGVWILADVVGSARGADVIFLAVGFPLLAYAIALGGMRRGIAPSDWDYDISLRSIGPALASVVVYYVVIGAFTVGYTQIVGTPQSAAASTALAESVGGTLWIAAMLFLANGIIVPITEELAWRGVIQTALMDSYGTYVGGVLTAVAFVGKHLIVDGGASVLRLVSLVVLGFVLCGLRARYGTTSSTVAHLVANSIATASVVFIAL